MARHTDEALQRLLVQGRVRAQAADFEHAGAVLAGAGEATVGRLGGAGRTLGIAFRLLDDLLGVFGNPARTGRSARTLVEGLGVPADSLAAVTAHSSVLASTSEVAA